MFSKNIIITIVSFLILSNLLYSQEFEERIIASGLTNPWEVLSDRDGHILFSERTGYVSRVNLNTLQKKQLLHINEVYQNNEGGLLGMAIHYASDEDVYFFLVYNYRGAGNQTLEKVVRYRLTGDTLIDPITLIDGIPGAAIHNGSRLLIDEDKLFITTGDAANTALPLDLSSLAGKVLRMNLDGSIPNDNPFPNSYVWTFGHRNPQGMTKINDKIFISEHGASTDDEINILEKGGNYGWARVHGYCDGNVSGELDYCNNNSIIEPLISLYPTSTVAVCGIDYYNHDALPMWKNSLLVSTLKNQRLMQLKLNVDQTEVLEVNEFFTHKYGRLRDVHVSKDGKIFLATSNGLQDKIIELSPIVSSIENAENSTKIYPNPTNSTWNVYLSEVADRFELYNSIGLLVNSIHISGSKHIEINAFDMNNNKLLPGIYIAKIFSGTKIQNIFLILQ